MKTLDEAESYLVSNDIPESKIITCSLYVHASVKELCEVYLIESTQSEIKDSARKLTRVLLNQFIEFNNKLDQGVEEQMDNVISDFEEGGKKAIGNMMPILNKATQNDETTNDIIEQISIRFFPEDFDLFEQPDI